MADEDRHGLFPALLKHWRGQRGLSQLDLALAAEVSSRHVSFLETGRSRPSPEMVVRLGATLDVPLRHVNAMLEAAGLEAVYAKDDAGLPEIARNALTLMKEHHEPYPLVVFDRHFDVVDLTIGAAALLGALLADPGSVRQPINVIEVAFDPAGAHAAITNFDEVGRDLLNRVQRDVLRTPDDEDLRALLDRVLAHGTVPDEWRTPDLTTALDPMVQVRLRLDDRELAFITTMTVFRSPHHVLLEELQIEHWLPVDDGTAAACRTLAQR